MKLILAQGNPESAYAGTRHNVGFDMLDRFASEQGASWAIKSKFSADVAEIMIEGEKVILAKPTTYYNETGRSARLITDFYKIDNADILVIHDELALPLGTVRTRSSGSDAGNNGIKSLNAALGKDFKRVRIGIYNELAARMDQSNFVTGKFSKDEQSVLDDAYPIVSRTMHNFIAGSHIDETVTIEK